MSRRRGSSFLSKILKYRSQHSRSLKANQHRVLDYRKLNEVTVTDTYPLTAILDRQNARYLLDISDINY